MQGAEQVNIYENQKYSKLEFLLKQNMQHQTTGKNFKYCNKNTDGNYARQMQYCRMNIFVNIHCTVQKSIASMKMGTVQKY